MYDTIPLIRRRHGLSIHREDEVRKWLLEQVVAEILTSGFPKPRISLLGDTFEDRLDMNRMGALDPEADPAATWALLRSRPDVERRYIVFLLQLEDESGDQQSVAMVLEEVEGSPSYWLASLPFTRDPESGVGQPGQAWRFGVVPDWETLPDYLQALVRPAEGARPARVGPTVSPPRPEIGTFFGELHQDASGIPSAAQVADIAGAVAGVRLVSRDLQGILVLRLAGMEWQLWTLQGELPTDLDDMIRYICDRDPSAQAVALVQIALFQGESPPRPGVQIVAEHPSGRAERFALLEFPEGPEGPMRVSRVVGRDLKPLPEGQGWLGVKPLVFFELTPISAGDV